MFNTIKPISITKNQTVQTFSPIKHLNIFPKDSISFSGKSNNHSVRSDVKSANLNIDSNDNGIDSETLNFYKKNANELDQKFQSVKSSISEYFKQSFKPSGKVLDIGTGSGKNLLILLNSGFDAYGIEPCDEFRDLFIKNNPDYSNRIVNGHLPYVNHSFDFLFSGIVCSSVLMHVPEKHLENSVKSIHKLLEPRGRLLISLPLKWPGIDQNNRDPDNRLFNVKSSDEWKSLFKNNGFNLIHEWPPDKNEKKFCKTWVHFLFERA